MRVTYEQLSKDPNSLSNLDQDLPNYAQHSVPIHSLPMVRQGLKTPDPAPPVPPPAPPPYCPHASLQSQLACAHDMESEKMF